MNYQKIYNSIIQKARSENRIKNSKIYYEAHHIIPTCLGGIGKCSQWKTHTNIILLTAREHFLCHWLLHEIHPDNFKLFFAFRQMSIMKNRKQLRYVPSSKIIEYARIKASEFLKNRKFSESHKKKLSIANTGKKRTEEQLVKMKEVMIGRFSGKKHHFYNKKRPELSGDNNPSKRLDVREILSKKAKLRRNCGNNKKSIEIIETGEILDSIKEGSLRYNVSYKIFLRWLIEEVIVKRTNKNSEYL
jgi:hypothetical protein